MKSCATWITGCAGSLCIWHDTRMPKSIYSERYRQFHRLLVQERKAANLTQAQLAVRLSKPQSYVAKYEGGERRLDVIEFLDVAQAIGFDPIKFIRKLVKQRDSRPGPRK